MFNLEDSFRQRSLSETIFSRISVLFTSNIASRENTVPKEFITPTTSSFGAPGNIPWMQSDSYLTSGQYAVQNHSSYLPVVIGRTNFSNGSNKRTSRPPGKLSDSKKISCHEPNCSKRFSRSQDLQVHVNKHHLKMIKPYVCNQCPKSFKRPDQLKRHEKIHTGEKPHSCRVCGRGFARTDHRNMHENKHSDDEKLQSMKHPRQAALHHQPRPSRRKLTKPEKFDPLMQARPIDRLLNRDSDKNPEDNYEDTTKHDVGEMRASETTAIPSHTINYTADYNSVQQRTFV